MFKIEIQYKHVQTVTQAGMVMMQEKKYTYIVKRACKNQNEANGEAVRFEKDRDETGLVQRATLTIFTKI